VIFLPADGRSAIGEFGPDGMYQLTTHEPGDGAVVGEHRVIVQARSGEGDAYGDESPTIVPSIIPLRYADPDASGLTVTVAPHDNQLDLRLSAGEMSSP
jgi:hypothetical protein